MLAVDSAAPGAYPAHWEADVLLRDGSTAHIRPILPEDAPPHRRASTRGCRAETIYYRFFAPYPVLSPRDVQRFTNVDHDDRVALVAMVAGEIVGVVRYDRMTAGGDEAEVAFVVRDDFQGCGLGSVLLEHLVGWRRERGVRRFVAEVLPANRRMLGVFRDAGYASTPRSRTASCGSSSRSRRPTSSRAVTERREHRAESRVRSSGCCPVVRRRSSGPAGTLSRSGRRCCATSSTAGFAGPVYAVNPHATEPVLGVPTYASVAESRDRSTSRVVAVPGRGAARRGRRLRRQGRARARRRVRRASRRSGDEGRGRSDAGRRAHAARHARRRAELPRDHQHRPRGDAQRVAVAGHAGRGPDRLLQPVRRAR